METIQIVTNQPTFITSSCFESLDSCSHASAVVRDRDGDERATRAAEFARRCASVISRGNNSGALLLLTAFLLCGGTSAAQEMTPVNDDTLHSAYCIPIVQGFVDVDKADDAELMSRLEAAQSAQMRALLGEERETLRKLTALDEAKLSRLRSHMPSALQPEPAALAEAAKRGEMDRERFHTEARQCMDRCFSPPYDGTKAAACMRSCVDTALHARIKACEAPGWLSQPLPSSRN